MQIEQKDIGDVTVIAIDGSIKTQENIAAFSAAIDAALSAGVKKLVLNLGGVNFINSSGLGRIIMALRKMGEAEGELKVSNLTSDLNSLFQFTKLSDRVDVLKTEEDAIKAFAS